MLCSENCLGGKLYFCPCKFCTFGDDLTNVHKNTCGGEEKVKRNLKERDRVEDQNVDKKIILKGLLKNWMGGNGTD